MVHRNHIGNCLAKKPPKPKVMAKGYLRPPSFPDTRRLCKLHLLDFRVVLSIVAVKAAKMMRVSNLARGKAVPLD